MYNLVWTSFIPVLANNLAISKQPCCLNLWIYPLYVKLACIQQLFYDKDLSKNGTREISVTYLGDQVQFLAQG
jgi:hypothetical protein